MRLTAVFNTNVLFSGSAWRGSPYRCLELARAGMVDGLTCMELVQELEGRLRFKLRQSESNVAQTIADLLGYLRLVTIPGRLEVIREDPTDDKVLECAVVGGATHVVTGDRRHLLALGSFQGIQIVSPAEFLGILAASE